MDVLGLIDRDIWGIDPFFHTTNRILNKADGHDIKVDMIEYEDHFTVKVNLPGVPSEYINVKFDTAKFTLTISVDQNTEREAEAPVNVHFRERSSFCTSRIIAFEHGSIKPESVVAKSSDGLLTINVDKVAVVGPQNSHVIDVKITR
jgi:HSP20 family protein